MTEKNSSVDEKSFNDCYDVIDDDNGFLGKGGFGTVKSCLSKKTSKVFACKRILSAKVNRGKILKEIEILKMCTNQENIVEMVDYFEDKDGFDLVFEKMGGSSMMKRLEKYGTINGGEAKVILKSVANALKFLHSKNIAHRDVKPSNILCSSDDIIYPLKLCDFGCSEVGERFTNVEGSFYYFAPEVAALMLRVTDTGYYTTQSDMWSLGATMYKLMTNEFPIDKAFCANCSSTKNRKSCCLEPIIQRIYLGNYIMNETKLLSISEEATNIIENLMVADPRIRYTADQVLKNPWVSTAY
ncbi:hypothetical protein HELRODRAFT_193759 [Helobdella robusta]|uniref:Protein kinase domain-containing protein n=1 Tax=Helobdella robusta TaxID=6412 RepID=T1FVB8_HELRO|nr:hypothetical protein HELRODRAFT_193759 [Helobdella robusta]ESN94906.1 hypothetical protein HELRODRAFT_193759 [Helobdella robusta]